VEIKSTTTSYFGYAFCDRLVLPGEKVTEMSTITPASLDLKELKTFCVRSEGHLKYSTTNYLLKIKDRLSYSKEELELLDFYLRKLDVKVYYKANRATFHFYGRIYKELNRSALINHCLVKNEIIIIKVSTKSPWVM
jgi:uncharacterized protein (DUF952 family)